MACVAFLLLYLVLRALPGWLWLVVAWLVLRYNPVPDCANPSCRSNGESV